MFKDFWEQKKHIIQFVGILAGVGALFLAIPAPVNNERAANALLYMQFVWLLLITASVVIFLGMLAIFIGNMEDALAKRHNLKLQGTLSLIVVILLLMFLINLWMYIGDLYRNQLIAFLDYASFSIVIGFWLFIIFIQARLASKFHRITNNALSALCVATLVFMLTYNPFDFLTSYFHGHITWDVSFAGKNFLLGFMSAFIFCEFYDWYKRKKIKMSAQE